MLMTIFNMVQAMSGYGGRGRDKYTRTYRAGVAARVTARRKANRVAAHSRARNRA